MATSGLMCLFSDGYLPDGFVRKIGKMSIFADKKQHTMSKISIITVQDIQISIATENNDDYICLTDMVKGQEGEDHIRNWMRNRNTIEFLGT
ncbi:MAG: KilA-N domain-containing protein [Bacteroidales bacterium]|nr:KilA-N domain-containing protein [Bacteroidales bacterium]